jgi:2-oxoisovalerate dehydrogenase E1 component
MDQNSALEFYRKLITPRMIEEKMLILLRQGKVSKWFSGIGQEAISVGATLALEQEDEIFTMHRNLGVFTSRDLPLSRLFAQFQGKQEGYTAGRDRSFHFGAPEHHITGMISHLGPQLSLANGVALHFQMNKIQNVALAFTGEGATSQGEFHEAMNIAATWKLPVIFIIENNGYALSTPSEEQFVHNDFNERAKAYGMKGVRVDGNDLLAVYETIRESREYALEGKGPVLIDAITFRVRGHEEASGTKYVPQELIDEWTAKDPISRFEKWLKSEGFWDEESIERIHKSIKVEIDRSWQTSEEYSLIEDTGNLEEVFASIEQTIVPPSETKKELRLVDAIKEGMHQALQEDSSLVFMGQDIAEYGGVFKATEGFVEAFGKARIRNTPLCESGVIGAAIGYAMMGNAAMVEMQFSDFVTCGFNQIVNNAAKLFWRWKAKINLVIRMPCGAGVGAGPFHSQSNEAWFFHEPGLKIIYPSNGQEAKGLLLSAFKDPNPVLFFEHKALYRSERLEVSENAFTIPIGKANWIHKGKQLNIITYGMGVHWAKALIEEMNADIGLLDLRSLKPLDFDAIKEAVEEAGKVIVLHEAQITGGVGAEISAWINEHCFEFLDGPVLRVAGLDSPVPFAAKLEEAYLPMDRLRLAINQLLKY